jgi:hypothetical protein
MMYFIKLKILYTSIIMKKINRIFLSALFTGLVLASCSKDDDPTVDGPSTQETLEARVIPTSVVIGGVEISGATKKAGAPPASNSNFTFQLEKEEQEALLNYGFEVRFTSETEITGAYISFEDANGNKGDTYFDVSVDSYSNGRIGQKNKLNGKLSNARNARIATYDSEIGIYFGNTIAPGNFCYEICVYDAQGNISQPQKVCVTVEAWGGNPAIVGEWILDREESTDGDGKTSVYCTNGDMIEVEYQIEEKDAFMLNFGADGSYYEIYDNIAKELDYSATEESCSAMYGETEHEKEKYSGNWAYNSKSKTISAVIFKYEDLLDASNNETSDEGELWYEDIKAEIIGGELVLTVVYTGDETPVTEKYYFKKK